MIWCHSTSPAKSPSWSQLSLRLPDGRSPNVRRTLSILPIRIDHHHFKSYLFFVGQFLPPLNDQNADQKLLTNKVWLLVDPGEMQRVSHYFIFYFVQTPAWSRFPQPKEKEGASQTLALGFVTLGKQLATQEGRKILLYPLCFI